jgi:hypothetical protein
MDEKQKKQRQSWARSCPGVGPLLSFSYPFWFWVPTLANRLALAEYIT